MKRLTTWLAVVALLLLFGLAAGWFFMPATTHYHLFADEASLNAVLFGQVKPGDSMARLIRLLGAGKPVDEQQRVKLLGTIANFQRQTPASTPDGVEPDDQFLGYEASGMTIYLQFRDERLINFRPEDFERPAGIRMTGR
jgi:hypothetical protein